MTTIDARRRWMGVLARARTADLAQLWQRHGVTLDWTNVRRPETGLVMVRGRAGGTGRRFNLGEMTVTRAAVQAPGGALGQAYVRGRDKRHAELAARFDALLQDPERRPALLAEVVAPLAAAQRSARAELTEKAAATKVEFFTMARGA